MKKRERESDIEEYLREQVAKLGGRAYKWVSPGNTGVPDRIVILPGNRISFVELKATGKEPDAKQKLQIERLKQLGADVWVIDSKKMVDEFIKIRGGAVLG